MRERRLFARRDLLLFGALLALCGLLFWGLSRSPKGAVAVVEQNGRVVLRQELAALEGPLETVVKGENGLSVTVEISGDGAAVTAAECPDQVCVRTGRLTQAGESALCLPAKISLRLEGETAADAETY